MFAFIEFRSNRILYVFVCYCRHIHAGYAVADILQRQQKLNTIALQSYHFVYFSGDVVFVVMDLQTWLKLCVQIFSWTLFEPSMMIFALQPLLETRISSFLMKMRKIYEAHGKDLINLKKVIPTSAANTAIIVLEIQNHGQPLWLFLFRINLING